MENIYNVLKHEHFIISEYMGEMILNDYPSIEKGPLKEMDFEDDEYSFFNKLTEFNNEWSGINNDFEEFVDGFYFNDVKSYMHYWGNSRKILNVLSGIWENSKFFMKEEVNNKKLIELINAFMQTWERFNLSFERLNKYLKAHVNMQNAAIIDSSESMDTSEFFKPCITVMEELTEVIDERNIFKMNSLQIKEFIKTCQMHIKAASTAIEMIESGCIPDETNLLEQLKVNSAKLKFMILQMMQYYNSK